MSGAADTRVIRAVGPGGAINYCCIATGPAGRAVLVDPAWDRDAILRAAAGRDVAAILLTHSHADHVDLAPVMAEQFGAPVLMSAAERAASGFACAGLVSCEEAGALLDALGVEYWPTPGHTIGSASYRVGRDVFSGDTLFVEGCGLPMAPGGDVDMLFDTVMRLAADLADDMRLFPGHRYGAPVGARMAEVRELNLYLHLTDRADFVEFRTRPGQGRAVPL